jgi:hypothetical protein
MDPEEARAYAEASRRNAARVRILASRAIRVAE